MCLGIGERKGATRVEDSTRAGMQRFFWEERPAGISRRTQPYISVMMYIFRSYLLSYLNHN